jgi:exosortase
VTNQKSLKWPQWRGLDRGADAKGLSGMGPPEKFPRWLVGTAVFGALWCMLIERLAQYWTVEPEYNFGWLVPLVCGYLFWLRWRSRPEGGVTRPKLARVVIGLTAGALFPTWLIAQGNPDWRIIAWLLTSETVLLCLGFIYLIGGRPWLAHFAWSICLILAAVPWPSFLESGAVQVLTRLSTTVTVGTLNLVGIDAVQQGNLIALHTGFLDVDAACSGIRSLQAVVMVALFLGELYRTSFERRYGLVFVGAVIAFLCNALRTTGLAMVAAKQGVESVGVWHDPVGYTMMAACFLLVIGAARVIAGPLPALPVAQRSRLSVYPYRLLLGFGGWLLFVGVSTEIWYRIHVPAGSPRWAFVWPVHKAEFADIPIAKLEAADLLFSDGRAGEWSNGDGSHWVAYFFKWADGPSWSRVLARGHRPEVCFPAAGYKACGDHGVIEIQARGLTIPFHALDFEQEGSKDYVFFCLWEDGLKSSERPRPQDKWSQLTRLRSVLSGQRNLAQQSLEIVISGYDTPEQAQTAFRREIVTLINTGTEDVVADASGSLVVPQIAKRQ